MLAGGNYYEDLTFTAPSSQNMSLDVLKEKVYNGIVSMIFGGEDTSTDSYELNHAEGILGNDGDLSDSEAQYFAVSSSFIVNDYNWTVIHFYNITPDYIKDSKKFGDTTPIDIPSNPDALETAKTKLKNAQEKEKNAQTTLDGAKKKLEEVQTKDKSNDEQSGLQNTLNEEKKKLAILEKDLSDKEANRDTARTKLANLKSQLADFENAQQKLIQAQTKLNDLNKQLKKSTDKLNALSAELTNKKATVYSLTQAVNQDKLDVDQVNLEFSNSEQVLAEIQKKNELENNLRINQDNLKRAQATLSNAKSLHSDYHS